MSVVSVETELGFTPQGALEDELQHRVSPTMRQRLLTGQCFEGGVEVRYLASVLKKLPFD